MDRKWWMTGVVAAAAVALVVVGIVVASGGDDESQVAAGPELTFEDLIGTWRVTDVGSTLELDEDGTYRIVLSALLAQRMGLSPGSEATIAEQGNFTLEGTVFTFISNEDSANCEAGQRGTYEMEVLEDGPAGEDRLKQNQVADECRTRGSEGDTTLERVS